MGGSAKGLGPLPVGMLACAGSDVQQRLACILLVAASGIDTGDMLLRIVQYYLPPPKPIEDKRPVTTRTLKSVLLSLVEGKVDPASFTLEALAALSPELKRTSEFYQSLGPLKSFTLIERRNGESNQTLRYRTVFGDRKSVV